MCNTRGLDGHHAFLSLLRLNVPVGLNDNLADLIWLHSFTYTWTIELIANFVVVDYFEKFNGTRDKTELQPRIQCVQLYPWLASTITLTDGSNGYSLYRLTNLYINA